MLASDPIPGLPPCGSQRYPAPLANKTPRSERSPASIGHLDAPPVRRAGPRGSGSRRWRRHGRNEWAIAVGRKNYLFAGSDQGAERAATIYSLLRTCDRHRVDAFAYLEDIPKKLAGDWPISRMDELMPDRWRAARDEERRLPAPATG